MLFASAGLFAIASCRGAGGDANGGTAGHDHSLTWKIGDEAPSLLVPAPTAEEMYMPETFGRGASDRVVVE